METNSMIPSCDILLIPYGYLSKTPEDAYDKLYNSASSAPTNPKVQLVEPDPTIYGKSKYDSISKNTITPAINLSDSKIHQHIWSRIFNNK